MKLIKLSPVPVLAIYFLSFDCGALNVPRWLLKALKPQTSYRDSLLIDGLALTLHLQRLHLSVYRSSGTFSQWHNNAKTISQQKIITNNHLSSRNATIIGSSFLDMNTHLFNVRCNTQQSAHFIPVHSFASVQGTILLYTMATSTNCYMPSQWNKSLIQILLNININYKYFFCPTFVLW